MTTYKGHCHCGQVEWTVKLEDASHILWFVPFCPRSSLPRRSLMPNCSSHCDACKLLSGGESTLNTIALKSDLNITKGNVKAYTYQGDSGKPVHCYYCPNCTSHVYHHQTVMGDDKIVIRTGLLEGGKDFKVAAEIFGKDRVSWQPEVAHTFEGPPT
ncbi:MAG: hypothetical protein LQ351_001008 [Letrouitia transgressa]|nr:MAG: hypothetical protein LQ351_001008 [Letrouitia transgressa]